MANSQPFFARPLAFLPFFLAFCFSSRNSSGASRAFRGQALHAFAFLANFLQQRLLSFLEEGIRSSEGRVKGLIEIPSQIVLKIIPRNGPSVKRYSVRMDVSPETSSRV